MTEQERKELEEWRRKQEEQERERRHQEREKPKSDDVRKEENPREGRRRQD